MELFGFEIKRKDREEYLPSFTQEVKDDGAVVVQAGGIQSTFVDLQGSAKTEAELVTKYRELSLQPEVDSAIDDIVNEAISIDTDDKPVEIILDDVENQGVNEKVKKRITSEFDSLLNMMDFNNLAYDIFRRWYIDGRIYYHSIIDESKPEFGIMELRYVDPRKIRKIREVKRERNANTKVELVRTHDEYFMFNERGFSNKTSSTFDSSIKGVKIAKDSIIHVTSGLTDADNTLVLSHLHKAIKPLNQLRSYEDAKIIYTLTRAPERRIFYIDVGNLPKMKAEQYVRDMMVRYKNRLVYNSTTGEIRDDRRFMTMLEDFWLPRREGGRGTQIDTLPPGQGLGDVDELMYFQKLLYRSLNVPTSRLDPDAGMSLGRASEISRDELKFNRFVERLRHRFNQLFLKLLEKHLVLKGVVNLDDWYTFVNQIKFKYAKDNYFTELKEMEIQRERFATVNEVDPFVGKYISREWVRKKVLMQTDDDIKELDKQMKEEEKEFGDPFEDPMAAGDDDKQVTMNYRNSPSTQDQEEPDNPPSPPKKDDGETDKDKAKKTVIT